MNYAKFFELAKANGLAQSQLQVSKSKSLSIRLFHHEIDNYSVNNSQSIKAAGIYKGKFGSCSTEKLDSSAFQFLIDGIKESAANSEKEGEVELFKGSEKYHKKNVYDPSLSLMPVEDKIAFLRKVDTALFAYDKRITDGSEVEFAEREGESAFFNSFGLKLKQKSNNFYVDISVVAKQGDETKTSFDLAFGSSLKDIDINSFIKKTADEALKKFGGDSLESGKYPTVIKNEVFADLINYYLSSTSAEEVQKKSSMLIGKLHQKVASSKLTITEKPLVKNVFFTYFDDEGVACYNKDIIKKGVLTTYLYNRETAKKDGVTSTANGQWSGDKIGIGYGNIFVKGGKKSFDELIAPITKGVYITDIAGLGTGINPQSGDFSCQAQGFLIENGKLTRPLNLITIGGNLSKMLNDIGGFDANTKMTLSSISCSDVLIKKMAIGGK
jgi:PmbA protein